MPSSLYHLNVSKQIAQKYPQYDNDNLYIGTIAPDAVNLYGFAEKSLRWSAHKRASNLKEWISNILSFYNEQKDNYEKSYLLGYIIHVLTDIVVDEMYFEEEIDKDIMKKRPKEENAFAFFKNQIDLYEKSQLNEQWWKDVKIKLNNCKTYKINNISEKQIKDWKEKVLSDYNQKEYEKYDYITPEFLNLCTKKVITILVENNIL